jgi:hypothetical protein
MRRTTAFTGHASSSVLRPWVSTSPFVPFFLSGEGEGNGGGCIEFGDRGMEEIEKSIIDVELNVLQTKWGVVRRSTGVLAWSKQKVEGDGDRVGYGFSIFG